MGKFTDVEKIIEIPKIQPKSLIRSKLKMMNLLVYGLIIGPLFGRLYDITGTK